MRKGITLFLLTLVCSTGAFAQAVAGLGAVSGSVRDATGAILKNNVPVPSIFAQTLSEATLLQELLFNDPEDQVLCHGDLHHKNFLA